MPRKFDIPGAENPFEKIGLDRALVEILAEDGDPSLMVGVTALKRAVARVFHPDVHGPMNDPTSEFYVDFMQAMSKLDDTNPAGRIILAKAYGKQKGGTRQKREEVSYESADFHDGQILMDLAGMAARSGESMAAVRSKRILMRPLNFSNQKPKGSPKGYDWYPAESAAISMAEISATGETTWTKLIEGSFDGELAKARGRKPSLDERREVTNEFSDFYWNLIGESVDTQSVRSAQRIYMIQQNGRIDVTDTNADIVASYDAPVTDTFALADGIYVFGFTDSKIKKRGSLFDAFYLFQGEDTSTEPSYVLGFSSNDELEVLQKRIYADMTGPDTVLREALPSTAKSSERYSFTIPEKMTKFIQRSFKTTAPRIATSDEKSLVIAAGPDGSVQVMGRLMAQLELSAEEQ